MSSFDDFKISYLKEVESLCTKILSASRLSAAEKVSILIYLDSAKSLLLRCSDYVSFVLESRDSHKND